MTKDINFNNFKARASKMASVVAENADSRKLTENQIKQLKELEEKEKRTAKQDDELTRLLLIQESSKEVRLGTVYIDYLMEEYAYITQGMVKLDKDFDALQTRNGTLVEYDSLVALILAEEKQYQPNINEDGEQDTIFNDYLTGKPDAFYGNSLMEAEEVPDIKSRFDYPTFLQKINTPISKAERYQVATYCLITGAKKGFIADCLSNISDEVKEGLKYRLFNKLKGKAATEESPIFKKEWEIIERSCNFNKLTPKERVYKRNVELFTQHETEFIYEQIKRGRDFLNKFHEERLKLL